MRNLIVLTCLGIGCLLSTVCTGEELPIRIFYPEIETIEPGELKSGLDSGKFIVVDIRSKTEFETIHIKNAINVPYDHAFFARYLDKIAQNGTNKTIVLYENGLNSAKVFKAADDAFVSARFLGVLAFDAGIAAWAETYPSETIVQGIELMRPEEQLVSEEKFNSKNLDYGSFKEKAAKSNAVVLDVRDPLEREGHLPGFEKALKVPTDKLVKNIIKKGNMKDKKLYIFDHGGRRVKWLMYSLIDNGYTDFYFLNGGATSVSKEGNYSVSVQY